MKKTYWWRIALLSLCILFIFSAYFGPCENKLMRCLGGNSILIIRTMFHLAIPIIVSSIILFFTSDKIFKKWSIFAVIWIFISLFFISITPEYSGGWVSFTPIREQVSIWMSSLFLIISLVLITVWQIKERKSLK